MREICTIKEFTTKEIVLSFLKSHRNLHLQSKEENKERALKKGRKKGNWFPQKMIHKILMTSVKMREVKNSWINKGAIIKSIETSLAFKNAQVSNSKHNGNEKFWITAN